MSFLSAKEEFFSEQKVARCKAVKDDLISKDVSYKPMKKTCCKITATKEPVVCTVIAS